MRPHPGVPDGDLGELAEICEERGGRPTAWHGREENVAAFPRPRGDESAHARQANSRGSHDESSVGGSAGYTQSSPSASRGHGSVGARAEGGRWMSGMKTSVSLLELSAYAHRLPGATQAHGPTQGSRRGSIDVGDERDVATTPPRNTAGAADSAQPMPSTSRVERLLRERFRRTKSSATLYQDGELAMHAGAPGMGPDLAPSAPSKSQRLLIVANRLPVHVRRGEDNEWLLQVSAGGLVSALLGVGNFQTKWIGWPGIYIESRRERASMTRALGKADYVPVFLDTLTFDQYYNGFCNQVLWNLFHYVPLSMDTELSAMRTMGNQWEAYKAANQAFADVVLEHYQDGDIVWCQDYHVMLLPSILKRAKPNMKVGWFLHTPFPSSEIYRTLPLREEILRGVLASDLVGFHTYDYARHFVSACTRILGLEGTPEGVEDNGILTRVSAFPIGIDPDRFMHALEAEEVRVHIDELRRRFAGRKVMLGVDRLDMIKGIPQKLLAVEKCLEEHPEWRDKVLLVQIAVPTRTEVPEYQKLRSTVHEIVGRINGRFGTLTHVPIHHLDRSLSFNELVALYAVTDVALVTSLRDGMNLVSFEYVACQRNHAGVLILSEFAGAAQSLGAGAILVNPWNVNDMASAIDYALNMSDQERKERHRQNFNHVTTHTAQTWAETFISELNDTHVEHQLRRINVPPGLHILEAADMFARTERHLLVMGFNAALTCAVDAPRQPKRHFDQMRALTKVHPSAYSVLRRLSQDPSSTLVIFSGSGRARLEEVFGDMPVWLVAENGVFVRPGLVGGVAHREWLKMVDKVNLDWMESVQLVFDYFCERTPRSFVEARETSLVWNYKYADVEFGRLQARDLLQHLWTGPISNAPVDIIQGAKSVEVRPVGLSKGASMAKVLRLMAEMNGVRDLSYDFVACIGHFLGRDEDIFTLFEGQNNPLVFGRPLDPTPPPPVGIALAVDADAGTVPGGAADGPDQAALPAALDPPLRPAGEPLPSERDALDRELYPHEESPEGYGSSANSSSANLAGMQGDSGAPGSATAKPTPPGPTQALRSTSNEYEGLPRDSAPVLIRPGPSGAGEASPSGTTVGGGRTYMSRVSLQGPTYRANHSLRGAENRSSSKEQAAEQRMFEAGERLRTSMRERSPPASSDGHRHSHHAKAAPAPTIPLALPPPALFTCTVGRQRSSARYLLMGSNEVASLLMALADAVSRKGAAAQPDGQGAQRVSPQGSDRRAADGASRAMQGAMEADPRLKRVVRNRDAALSSSGSVVGGDSGYGSSLPGAASS